MDELEKNQARQKSLKRKETAIKKKRRKTENSRKYKLGGMIVKAGLDTLDDDVIIGLLFAQKNTLAENKAIKNDWRELGIKASIKPEKLGVIVKFLGRPLEEITKKLHAKKLRWNRISKQWEGTILREELEEIQAIAGNENVTGIEL
ncbi:MAG: conjugal transfer protein TraD [Aliivibrio sp.]|uniref:conjugal transfer protein TraD n=1 Tax=Aliivibrio sp. TaxID=1872443 RepID=UPI001A540186|nr:conjugal transfer protein TraD [Aliivibrio sp.]